MYLAMGVFLEKIMEYHKGDLEIMTNEESCIETLSSILLIPMFMITIVLTCPNVKCGTI